MQLRSYYEFKTSYLIEKNTKITAISSTMFINVIQKNGVPDLDQVYQSHFTKKDTLSKIERKVV